MLRKRHPRRVLATFLVVLGGVLMFLAPEVWTGLAVLVLGVAIELAGIALEHKT
jgi:hypothetical protein